MNLATFIVSTAQANPTVHRKGSVIVDAQENPLKLRSVLALEKSARNRQTMEAPDGNKINQEMG